MTVDELHPGIPRRVEGQLGENLLGSRFRHEGDAGTAHGQQRRSPTPQSGAVGFVLEFTRSGQQAVVFVDFGFGFAVGISGDNAVVGAFRHDDPETNVGAAYVYAALLSLDDDGNGIPDACEPLLGDLNSDGVVNSADLIILLAFWGPCPPPPLECLGDLNADEVVGVADLLILLGNWS